MEITNDEKNAEMAEPETVAAERARRVMDDGAEAMRAIDLGGTDGDGGGGGDVLAQGAECMYHDAQGGQECVVKILKVHYDSQPPYYTVKMPDGNERETVRGRLSRKAGRAEETEGSPTPGSASSGSSTSGPSSPRSTSSGTPEQQEGMEEDEEEEMEGEEAEEPAAPRAKIARTGGKVYSGVQVDNTGKYGGSEGEG